MMEHTPTLAELAQDDPELKNYIITVGGRFLSGLENDDLFLSTAEAPRCPCCGRPNDGTVAIRRENTAYCDDVNNWLISCRTCFDERAEHWAEQWEDYYSMAL
jgi:hypothetical protein